MNDIRYTAIKFSLTPYAYFLYLNMVKTNQEKKDCNWNWFVC